MLWFGESIELLQRSGHKLDKRCDRGVYLVIKEASSEKIVGTPKGVYVVQSIRRRLPADVRYDAEMLARIRGLPWGPSPEEQESSKLVGQGRLEPERPDVPV